MINKNSLIPQYESIISDIKNSNYEIEEFKKSLELCKLVFQNSNLNQNNELLSDDVIDIILELKPVSEDIIKLLEFYNNSLNEEYKDFKDHITFDINSLNKLNEELESKNNECKLLMEKKKKFQLIQSEISQVQIEIDKYERIDIEFIKKELMDKSERLDILKSEKETDIKIWEKHLEENTKIDLHHNEIFILSKDIEEKLRELDIKIKEQYKGNI